MRRLAWLPVILLAVLVKPSYPQNVPTGDLKKLTLEQLMDVDVTSVSRKEEPLGRTAAAITVITGEDIRRTGVTSIPEALRLVPGIQVARLNAGAWAISSRGFNSTAANKLLVMIDGRTVYSPLFSGVFWELQDLVLDDITRIEVVRGPGATLWGANAVNGVINIITRSSHQTKNTAIVLTGGGASDLALASVRTGGAIDRNTSFRAFGKYIYRDQMVFADGSDAKDSERIGRTGFRIDSSQGRDQFMFEGDAYRGFSGILGRDDAKVLGGDVVGRWNRKISNTSEIQVQAYYDRMFRRVPLQSDFRLQTIDVDMQHQFQAGVHQITWGAGYRSNKDTNFTTPVLSFVPLSRSYPVETAFIQDEVALSADRVKLQVGSKFEHNDFTGVEIQPSIRASWEIRPEHFVWGAVSRAVRTPTRFDSDIRFGPPGFRFVGDPSFESEELVAFEWGYRSRVASRLSADGDTFFNVYDQIRSLEFQPATGSILLRNNLNAKTYGGELTATYDATEWLRFTTGYSYLGRLLQPEPGHVDIFNGTIEGNDPKHQFLARGSADLSHGIELDSTLRFVSQLPSPVVPRYWELDSRLGWSQSAGVELSIIGRNLLHAHHPEFGALPLREEVERNIYGRIAWRF